MVLIFDWCVVWIPRLQLKLTDGSLITDEPGNEEQQVGGRQYGGNLSVEGAVMGGGGMPNANGHCCFATSFANSDAFP